MMEDVAHLPTDLSEERAKLREALAFYADSEGYDVHPASPILRDMGQRARSALGDTQS